VPYVDIEGSGSDNTTILSATSGSTTPTLLVATSAVEIRELAIVNNDVATGGTTAIGLGLTSSIAPKLTNLDVRVVGQSSTAVIGIDAVADAGPIISDSSVSVSSTTATKLIGIYTSGSAAMQYPPVVQRVVVSSSLGAPASIAYAWGIATVAAPAIYDDVTITATGVTGGEQLAAMLVDHASATIQQLTARASGGLYSTGLQVTALAASENANVSVRDSYLSGVSFGFQAAVTTSSTLAVEVANSEIVGACNHNGTALTLVFRNDYDAAFAPYTCP
jgi:hypothetical protein